MSRSLKRGVGVAEARRLVLGLAGVTEGRSYGMPSFLVGGKFFARFRDHDTVLVLRLGTIADRDVLMQLEPPAFFFTDHYRDYLAALIRLAEVPRRVLAQVLKEAWRDLAVKRATGPGREVGRARPARRRSAARKRPPPS
ncbi:MAG: MmcQ/YjbR family DNA-binding protein [Gemmatimonadales bacterium]